MQEEIQKESKQICKVVWNSPCTFSIFFARNLFFHRTQGENARADLKKRFFDEYFSVKTNN